MAEAVRGRVRVAERAAASQRAPGGGRHPQGDGPREADEPPLRRRQGHAPLQDPAPAAAARPARGPAGLLEARLRPHAARGVRAAGRAVRRGRGPRVEGDGAVDQVRGARRGGRRPLGAAARRLAQLPLAAQPAPLPGDGRRDAGLRGARPARRRVPRRRADGHLGADPAQGPGDGDARPPAAAPARQRARALPLRHEEGLRQLHQPTEFE